MTTQKTTPVPSADAPTRTLHLVYVGTGTAKGGTKLAMFAHVSPEEFNARRLNPARFPDASVAAFNGIDATEPTDAIGLEFKSIKKHTRPRIGAVYTMEQPLDKPNTYQVGTIKWVTTWDTAWTVEREAVETAQERTALGRKVLADVGKSDPLRDACEPLRVAYRKVPAPHRAQLLAAMVQYITRGGE